MLKSWFFAAAVVILLFLKGSQSSPRESTLFKKLVQGHSTDIRPEPSGKDGLTRVNITIKITQVLDIDEKKEILSILAWVTMQWEDKTFTWDPGAHDNLRELKFPADAIWTPDIILYNTDDIGMGFHLGLPQSEEDQHFYAEATANSSMTLAFPHVFKSACALSIGEYPFDTQRCELQFGSWTHDNSEMLISITGNAISQDKHYYIQNKAWKQTTSTCQSSNKRCSFNQDRSCAVASCYIEVERTSWFEVVSYTLPTVVISILSLMVFMVPPEAGKRMEVGITLILCVAVYLSLINKKMPSTSKSFPLVSQFYGCVIVEITIAMVCSCYCLHIYDPEGLRLLHFPNYLRTMAFGVLARVICYKTDGGKPSRVHPTKEVRSSTDRQRKQTTKSNGDAFVAKSAKLPSVQEETKSKVSSVKMEDIQEYENPTKNKDDKNRQSHIIPKSELKQSVVAKRKGSDVEKDNEQQNKVVENSNIEEDGHISTQRNIKNSENTEKVTKDNDKRSKQSLKTIASSKKASKEIMLKRVSSRKNKAVADEEIKRNKASSKKKDSEQESVKEQADKKVSREGKVNAEKSEPSSKDAVPKSDDMKPSRVRKGNETSKENGTCQDVMSCQKTETSKGDDDLNKPATETLKPLNETKGKKKWPSRHQIRKTFQIARYDNTERSDENKKPENKVSGTSTNKGNEGELSSEISGMDDKLLKSKGNKNSRNRIKNTGKGELAKGENIETVELQIEEDSKKNKLASRKNNKTIDTSNSKKSEVDSNSTRSDRRGKKERLVLHDVEPDAEAWLVEKSETTKVNVTTVPSEVNEDMNVVEQVASADEHREDAVPGEEAMTSGETTSSDDILNSETLSQARSEPVLIEDESIGDEANLGGTRCDSGFEDLEGKLSLSNRSSTVSAASVSLPANGRSSSLVEETDNEIMQVVLQNDEESQTDKDEVAEIEQDERAKTIPLCPRNTTQFTIGVAGMERVATSLQKSNRGLIPKSIGARPYTDSVLQRWPRKHNFSRAKTEASFLKNKEITQLGIKSCSADNSTKLEHPHKEALCKPSTETLPGSLKQDGNVSETSQSEHDYEILQGQDATFKSPDKSKRGRKLSDGPKQEAHVDEVQSEEMKLVTEGVIIPRRIDRSRNNDDKSETRVANSESQAARELFTRRNWGLVRATVEKKFTVQELFGQILSPKETNPIIAIANVVTRDQRRIVMRTEWMTSAMIFNRFFIILLGIAVFISILAVFLQSTRLRNL